MQYHHCYFLQAKNVKGIFMIVVHTVAIVSRRSRLHSYTAVSVNETALTTQFYRGACVLIGSPVVKHDGYWQH